MIKHYIILGSSYTNGERFAIDFLKINNDFRAFIERLKEIDNKYYSIATHTISTKTIKWSEVVKIDPFFDKVKLLKTPDEFFDYMLMEKN